MDFSEVIKKRQSIRVFKKEEINSDKLEEILEAVNSAPSAGNLQAYKIYVVRKSEIKKKLTEASFDQDFISEASIVLVFMADSLRSARKYGERGADLYSLQDATIAATFAWLKAVDLGLAGCWVGAFNDEAVKKILEAPADLKPAVILSIGSAVEEPLRASRQSLKDIVHFL
mgnify:CR=1 FL=1